MTTSSLHPTGTDADVIAIVAAFNEADRIAATIAGLAQAFPGAPVWVADDGSSDDTAAIAEAAGARVVRCGAVIGKGGAVTRAVREMLRLSAGEYKEGACERVVVLCDGDLGESTRRLRPLVEAVRAGEADVAVAAFARRVGGGVGLALGFARWTIRRRCGLELRAPISGQRALRASVLDDVLPLAAGFGMEIGMTVDAARAGHRVVEIELDLAHRATGRSLSGFAHRGRQLLDFVRVYIDRG
jgi:glycosyltransferase involved in cell wall biosynthesis